MTGLVGGGVGPVERVGVRQRHVARTEIVKHAQHSERVFDRVAAFDADQRGDLARLSNALDIVGGVGHLESVGVTANHAVNQIHLFEAIAGCSAFRDRVDRDESGPELSADTALDQPRDVGVQAWLRFGDVELF